jgi:hypothetical protein
MPLTPILASFFVAFYIIWEVPQIEKISFSDHFLLDDMNSGFILALMRPPSCVRTFSFLRILTMRAFIFFILKVAEVLVWSMISSSKF